MCTNAVSSILVFPLLKWGMRTSVFRLYPKVIQYAHTRTHILTSVQLM